MFDVGFGCELAAGFLDLAEGVLVVVVLVGERGLVLGEGNASGGCVGGGELLVDVFGLGGGFGVRGEEGDGGCGGRGWRVGAGVGGGVVGLRAVVLLAAHSVRV